MPSRSSGRVLAGSPFPASGWLASTRFIPSANLLLRSCLFAGFALTLTGPSISAQQPGWNAPEALRLIARARAQRQSVRGDSTFYAYSAEARGYVYFYLDRADGGEPALVKTDQVALDVYWRAPNWTRQQIVGLRDEERLPTNIRYHLDHLTVVQDEFQDVIRLGDGDEVAAVAHPTAPGSERIYDFRLADSVTISFAGPQGLVRVYEVEVRPKDFGAPGFIGSIFLEREAAAIVRMNFTFTPSSYADDYLDYIRISLDNSLWDGRYWLPYEQRVELRRELPFLDFPAGTVIRGRYRIRNYEFNPELPASLFLSRAVSALPEDQLRAFPFEQGLYDQLDEDGLAPVPELSEIRAEAARMVGKSYLSGLAATRLWVPNASQVLRYDRAEGAVLGLGGSFTPWGVLRARIHGGFAVGSQRPNALLDLSPAPDGSEGLAWTARLFLNHPVDLGGKPAISGVLNTLGGAVAGVDYLDPYFSSGVSAGIVVLGTSALQLRALTGVERHRSANNVVADAPVGDDSDLDRPVPRIESGWLTLGGLRLSAQRGQALRGEWTAKLGNLESRTFGTLAGSLEYSRSWLTKGVEVNTGLQASWTSSSAPAQTWVLLGGRGTLPGHGFHRFAADRHALGTAEITRDVVLPWLKVSAFVHGGRGWLRARQTPDGWPVQGTNGTLFSLGLGTRLLWDAVRVDLARGLDGGTWEFGLAVSRRFHPWL